jgi:hypothetical protein
MATYTPEEFREMLGEMREIFRHAVSFRKDRPGWVKTAEGDMELGWMRFERQQMLEAVNVVRAERQLPEVTMEEVIRADRMAAGHVDYALKFSLYCAELALGAWPEP